MDLSARLRRNGGRANVDAIVNWIGDNKVHFDALLSTLKKGDATTLQHGVWPMAYAAIAHPVFIKKHLTQLLKWLDESHHHDAVYRNVLKIFTEVDIPEKHAAALFDACIVFAKAEHRPVAIRAYALMILMNLVKRWPELQHELTLIATELLKLPQPPGVTATLKKCLKSK
jgi:hypothetical protein